MEEGNCTCYFEQLRHLFSTGFAEVYCVTIPLIHYDLLCRIMVSNLSLCHCRLQLTKTA